jgi:transcription elongation GreA/GreB family factor
MSAANWTSIGVAVLAFLGTIFGVVVSSRANKRTAANQTSLNTLEWAKEFEKRTQVAETKAAEAAKANAENERRTIELERKLARAESMADSLVELVQWVGQVVELAHDSTDGDRERLVRLINGGPPVYHRHRP